MKKYKVLLALILVICIFAGCSSSVSDIPVSGTDESAVSEPETPSFDMEENEETVTVYRTKSGECYHRSGCVHLKSKIAISLDGAINMGLRPCSRCNP